MCRVMSDARPSLIAGHGDATVCFVHGSAGNAGVWVRQIDGLGDVARMVAIDLPGHGEAGGDGCRTIDDYVDAVVAALDPLGPPRLTLVGHSLGGAIAQTFALKYPGRLAGLVLIGTGARLRVMPRLFEELAGDYTRGARLLIDLCLADGAPPELIESLYRQTLRVPGEVTIADLRACDRFDVMQRVNVIAVPTLVLCGTEDRLTPPKYAEFLHRQIRGARLVLIPGAGHYVQLERPDAVTAALRDFLVYGLGNNGARPQPGAVPRAHDGAVTQPPSRVANEPPRGPSTEPPDQEGG
jgi:pimeloyl-ACP methyl ester carboxylesterase